MKTTKKSMPSGIYVVIDPSMAEEVIGNKLEVVLAKGIAAVQIWDHFKVGQNKVEFIEKVCGLASRYDTLVLINNQWEYLKNTGLDGVHFDSIPTNFPAIKNQIPRAFIAGLTCGNNLENVHWAAENEMDYISFCSLFPSKNAENCEIISHETVQAASVLFQKPLFLAGGIYPENIPKLKGLKFDGIAVISGIMDAEFPNKTLDNYQNQLKKIQ